MVSHDRFFVSEIANKIWYIEDEEIKVYPGTYDEYETWQEQRVQNGEVKQEKSPKKTVEKVVEKKPVVEDFAKKEAQKNHKKLSQKLSETEELIAKLESEKSSQENTLADPAIYNDAQALKRENAVYQQIQDKLKIQNNIWEEIMIEMEKLEGVLS